MRPVVLATFALAALAGGARAQQAATERLDAVCSMARDQLKQLAELRTAAVPDANRVRTLAGQVGILDQKMGCLVAAFLDVHPIDIRELLLTDLEDAIKSQEASRSDKQTGATSGAGGSTSLVSSGATAKVLSFATEYGALTQSVNQQTVTVGGNLAGLPTALIEQGLLHACMPGSQSSASCINKGPLGFLRRFSFWGFLRHEPQHDRDGDAGQLQCRGRRGQLYPHAGDFLRAPERDLAGDGAG